MKRVLWTFVFLDGVKIESDLLIEDFEANSAEQDLWNESYRIENCILDNELTYLKIYVGKVSDKIIGYVKKAQIRYFYKQEFGEERRFVCSLQEEPYKRYQGTPKKSKSIPPKGHTFN